MIGVDTTAPERIFLQTGGNYENAGEVEWCEARTYESDQEYIRADLAKPRVRRLVWEPIELGGEEAVTPFGTYVSFAGKVEFFGRRDFYPKLIDGGKPAAQADFERRVRECLE